VTALVAEGVRLTESLNIRPWHFPLTTTGGYPPQSVEGNPLLLWQKGETMPLKDLRGKTVRDLDRRDFDKLFCQHCCEYEQCLRDDKKIRGCKTFVDTGLWDKFYRKQ